MNAFIKKIDWELILFSSSLLYLAITDPNTQGHFTLYPPYYLFGIKSPGYNLGHSISYLLHGNIIRSLQSHWLGIPATVILLMRIMNLIQRKIKRGGEIYG